jgi:UV excision repair protein RAD23
MFSVDSNLNFLRDNPTFQRLREIVQKQPAMIEGLMKQLSTSDPQLAQAMSQNSEAFVRLLTEV